jgi:transcriptional regulator with XRE-family HTH domain
MTMDRDFATTAPTSRESVRSVTLHGSGNVITITVGRDLVLNSGSLTSGSPATVFGRLKQGVLGALMRAWARVAHTAPVEPLELTDLPAQLIVLSHYQQALQGLPGDTELADAIGVSAGEVAQWKAGQVPSDEKLRRLRDLATIVARLAEYYEPAAIPDWLYGRNPDLGGRQPIELLREGNLVDVLSVAEAQISGAYI